VRLPTGAITKFVPLALAFCTALTVSLSCLGPATRIDRQAERLGLSRSVVEGTEFGHVIYQSADSSTAGPLHIYLEGDGSPWIGETRISSDPTPRRAYALELMALDSRSSAYIGRPCYHGEQKEEPCNPGLWTHQRYSPQVVDSLEATIRSVAAERSDPGLILIGFSGGGVLAMLLADRLQNTRAIVTIASNLDIDAWTELHDYSPLTDSLNPARQPPLPTAIRQFHLAGGRDTRVPPEIIEPAAGLQPDSQYRMYPEFDHTCCWTEIWREILAEVAESLE
jgi:dienelactone hydrolase